jgi:hypothetical protein
MRLSNKAKHEMAVGLVSDYLINNEYEHLVISSEKSFDIYVPLGGVKIKVFCNYSGSENIKVSSDFECEGDILYLVVKPTRNNVHGFSCLGGDKNIIEKSLKTFDTKGSPKNIQTELLRSISIFKHIENRKIRVDQNQAVKEAANNCYLNLSSMNDTHCDISNMPLYPLSAPLREVSVNL